MGETMRLRWSEYKWKGTGCIRKILSNEAYYLRHSCFIGKSWTSQYHRKRSTGIWWLMCAKTLGLKRCTMRLRWSEYKWKGTGCIRKILSNEAYYLRHSSAMSAPCPVLYREVLDFPISSQEKHWYLMAHVCQNLSEYKWKGTGCIRKILSNEAYYLRHSSAIEVTSLQA
jgi:hypothetical protein